MKRRDFLALLGGAALATPNIASADTADRVYRLGTIQPVVPLNGTDQLGKMLVDALAQRGYVLGKNLVLEARGARGDVEKLPALIDELKAVGAEVLVSFGYAATVAAKSAGIPTVVGWGVGDPVETHLIESLTHPGGNITGISDVAAELTTKRLQLLEEITPRLDKVAMLWNEHDLGMTLRYEASAKVARDTGITVQALGVRKSGDLDQAFAAMTADPPDAMLMVADALTISNSQRIFEFASSRRLPAIYEYDFLVRDGGLMSYGADVGESLVRAAAFVDRIFRGAKPADLPFERPVRYPLAVNLKAARKAGLDVPPTLLALADEVIE
ncbi:ABC transporter substrate-binding protein [Bradyrhizobium sp. NAS80.1]|uniref:ABC transporter substrate-binding protein n=1 Tax=Bradyrhizobium sp. NAS80.1 TaxID=1680159 RepID=UPI000A00B0EA|nr:ABC transporter substrate-binding protein [Bradyrhizobium sp. NAS80.1]